MGSLRIQRERDLREIKYKLQDWIEYLDHTWSFFEEDGKRLENWISEQGLDPNDSKDKNKVNKLIEKYTLLFPHRHLSSIFIKIYVVFESELETFNYCLKYFRHINLDSEIEEKFIKSKDNYFLLRELFKKMELDVNLINPEYTRMQHFKKLRDSLVHNRENNILSKPNDRVFRQFLEKSKGIVITDSMAVQEGFVHTYFLHSKEIIVDLKETVSRFYDKAFDLGYGASE